MLGCCTTGRFQSQHVYWGDICTDMVGFVGQITVTGGCCLNGDETIAHTLDVSGMGK